MRTLSYPLIAFGIGSLAYLQLIPGVPTGTNSGWNPLPLFVAAAVLTLGLLILVCASKPPTEE